MRRWVRAEEARKLLSEVKAVHKQEYISPYNIALVYFQVADNTMAFEWLERPINRTTVIFSA